MTASATPRAGYDPIFSRCFSRTNANYGKSTEIHKFEKIKRRARPGGFPDAPSRFGIGKITDEAVRQQL